MAASISAPAIWFEQPVRVSARNTPRGTRKTILRHDHLIHVSTTATQTLGSADDRGRRAIFESNSRFLWSRIPSVQGQTASLILMGLDRSDRHRHVAKQSRQPTPYFLLTSCYLNEHRRDHFGWNSPQQFLRLIGKEIIKQGPLRSISSTRKLSNGICHSIVLTRCRRRCSREPKRFTKRIKTKELTLFSFPADLVRNRGNDPNVMLSEAKRLAFSSGYEVEDPSAIASE